MLKREREKSTRWVGKINRKIGNAYSKHGISKKRQHRNLGRYYDKKNYRDDIVKVKRIGDNIIVVKLISKEEIT